MDVYVLAGLVRMILGIVYLKSRKMHQTIKKGALATHLQLVLPGVAGFQIVLQRNDEIPFQLLQCGL